MKSWAIQPFCSVSYTSLSLNLISWLFALSVLLSYSHYWFYLKNMGFIKIFYGICTTLKESSLWQNRSCRKCLASSSRLVQIAYNHTEAILWLEASAIPFTWHLTLLLSLPGLQGKERSKGYRQNLYYGLPCYKNLWCRREENSIMFGNTILVQAGIFEK